MVRVFEEIGSAERAVWGRCIVRLQHRLAELDLFSDESLAQLIERSDSRRVDISTMADDVSTWGHCDYAGLSGAEVLEAVSRGRLWVNLMGIDQTDQRFADILHSMYRELETSIPGFKVFKRQLGLLISSPGAQVFYHFDVPGQGLWQIRGSKRIWIYPASHPFLSQVDVENVVRSLDKEDVPYEHWFDEHAEVCDLKPGDMLHWPLNGPHRVVNGDMVNVSLTTEHWTPSVRRRYAMNYGNGVLRRQFGWRPRSTSVSGPAFWAKVALTAAYRLTGAHSKSSYKRLLSYRVDPMAPFGRSEIPENDRISIDI